MPPLFKAKNALPRSKVIVINFPIFGFLRKTKWKNNLLLISAGEVTREKTNMLSAPRSGLAKVELISSAEYKKPQGNKAVIIPIVVGYENGDI